MFAVNLNNRNGRYALTEGRYYSIINHSRGTVTLRNDNGLRANYSESLFNIVEENPEGDAPVATNGARVTLQDIPTPVPEPVAPPRVAFTDQMVCDSVQVEVNHNINNNEIRITVRYNSKEFVDDEDNIIHMPLISLGRFDTVISCGVHQISGIRHFETLKSRINYQLRDYDGLIETIYSKIKEAWEDQESSELHAAIYIASDVYTEEREVMMEALGFENVTGVPILNRNSGNVIVVYQKCREEDRGFADDFEDEEDN